MCELTLVDGIAATASAAAVEVPKCSTSDVCTLLTYLAERSDRCNARCEMDARKVCPVSLKLMTLRETH